MPFLDVSPCCVSSPGELPGTPRGMMQPAEGARTVPRYFVQPQTPIKDSKAALILLYDLMGFQTSNPKILADQYAEALGIPVFVPDYIPNAPKPIWFGPITETYPDELAKKSWFATIRDYLIVFSKLLFKIPGYLDGSVKPLVDKAIQEIKAEGYEKVGAIGHVSLLCRLTPRYCRGGAMVIHLLSAGDKSLIDAGVTCHPGPVPKKSAYLQITKPSQWHFASHDPWYKEEQIADVRRAMEGRDVVFENTVYDQTVHGFAARPNLDREPSKKAFEEANAAAVKFFQTHLKLPLE